MNKQITANDVVKYIAGILNIDLSNNALLLEDMIEDIEGAKYCLLDSGDICPVCGIYEHQCETGE